MGCEYCIEIERLSSGLKLYALRGQKWLLKGKRNSDRSGRGLVQMNELLLSNVGWMLNFELMDMPLLCSHGLSHNLSHG